MAAVTGWHWDDTSAPRREKSEATTPDMIKPKIIVMKSTWDSAVTK